MTREELACMICKSLENLTQCGNNPDSVPIDCRPMCEKYLKAADRVLKRIALALFSPAQLAELEAGGDTWRD